MKKEDQLFSGIDVYSSFVSAQKKEQRGSWGDMTSMKKKYTHIQAFVCTYACTCAEYLFVHEQTSVEYYF